MTKEQALEKAKAFARGKGEGGMMARAEGLEPSLHGFGDQPTTLSYTRMIGTDVANRTPSHRFTVGVLLAIEHRQHGPERACRSRLAAL
jgi:hypothetical protein